MQYFVVGLGNPGLEYENTRHNTGRIVLNAFAKAQNFPEWETNPRLKALVSSGEVKPLEKSKGKKQKVMLIEPETFMNKSALSVVSLVKSKKTAEQLVVIHDDIDIPFGSYKISFNKSSGGHRGVESIIKAIKTEMFVRVRVGISPVTAKGVVKKPSGEEAVEKLILGKFTPDQMTILKKISKNIAEGLAVLITESREKAMSQYRQ